MFAFDWPTASVTITCIAAFVIMYAVGRLANNAIILRQDRMQERIASYEERITNLTYRVADAETRLKQK